MTDCDKARETINPLELPIRNFTSASASHLNHYFASITAPTLRSTFSTQSTEMRPLAGRSLAQPNCFGRAIPCAGVAQQRQKIIRNRVALAGEESVSVGHRRQRPPSLTGRAPPMRIYIIGNDGITLCHQAPATVDESEIAVASKEELRAAPLSGKRLLALWNALPDAEKRRKVGDREALIDQLWTAIEALPDPEPQSDA